MFRMIGTVHKGLGKGTALGFPTANLERLRPPLELPAGVYAVRIKVNPRSLSARTTHRGAMVVGARTRPKVLTEVFILDWSEDIYDKEVLVEVHTKVSDIVKIKTRKELLKKIAADIAAINKIL